MTIQSYKMGGTYGIGPLSLQNIKLTIDGRKSQIGHIHTLCVQYAHDAANLNLGLSKYAKVARVHYFCTIALRTPNASVGVAYGAFT